MIIGRLRDAWDKQPELGGLNDSDSLLLFRRPRFGSLIDYYRALMNTPSATGLLLIFPSLFVHYLEVTDAALKLILEDLNHSRSNELIREARILNISYNVRIERSQVRTRTEPQVHLCIDPCQTLCGMVVQKH